jgi:retron-type reverse transcriptase
VIFKIDFEKAYDSIRWEFVAEVLAKKCFDNKLRGWVMSTVRGGKVCVNINGGNGPYFKTHRGLRQRDPLSPLLFNLAVDALAHILDKAKGKGYIKGVVPHLIPGGLTHLQYADDTILLCENDIQSITNMKFLLYCFEWMSGLKINYHKSEVVTFGVDKENEDNIANMLNCKVGSLPMKYLGFPISDKRLG